MKIAIDTAPLASGHSARGMGVYTKNLISSLEKLSNTEKFELDAFEFNKNKNKLDNYDLIHYPYFDLFSLSLPLRKTAKTIVTVPDVIPLLYPNYYPPGVKGKIKCLIQKKSLNNINAIITLSETSKKDIVRLLKIPQEKVHPIHLAPGFKFKKQSEDMLSEVRIKYHLPNKYVLYVGDVNYNKNLLLLIKATKSVNVPLVIIGKQAIVENYDKLHIENQTLKTIHDKYENDKGITRLGFLENAEFMSVWQMATAYCQPSLYEGFGLPVLEAFEVGLPVIAARTQALVEVAGTAAIYFDSKDYKDLANKISKFMINSDLRINYINKGKNKLSDYSWKKVAKETYEIYKKNS